MNIPFGRWLTPRNPYGFIPWRGWLCIITLGVIEFLLIGGVFWWLSVLGVY